MLQLAKPQTLDGVLTLVQQADAPHQPEGPKSRKPNARRGLTAKNMESLRQSASVARLCRRLATIETTPTTSALGERVIQHGLDALQRNPVDEFELERIIARFPALRKLKTRLTYIRADEAGAGVYNARGGEGRETREEQTNGSTCQGWSEHYRAEIVGAHFAQAGKAVLVESASAAARGSLPSLGGVTISVRREPNNEHDPLALAVHLPVPPNEDSGRSDGEHENRLGYLAGWLAKVLSPLVDDDKISIEGRVAAELRDWEAALSRRRLPLEIHVCGQGTESHKRLAAHIEQLRS